MNHQQFSRPTKLVLKGTPEELAGLVAKKVLLIARRCADLPIVVETATAEECRQESHLAKSLVLLMLYDDDEVIAVATSRAMMRFLAFMAAANRPSRNTTTATMWNNLMGTSITDEAMINGWLNYFWTSIELPLSSLLACEEGTSKKTAEIELTSALKTIDKHLSKQQSSRQKSKCPLCIVSPAVAPTCSDSSGDASYTLVDLSLAVTLQYMVEKNIAVAAITREENPFLYDWNQKVQVALDQL
mmetsp:Transcript_11415/g.32867  ORF Transcript_11415/g.32867 Transcript_11415/m.32867 type:complete len:244 (+) Transcript_11415:99-830(+)